mgnify:CR=1 FL=1
MGFGFSTANFHVLNYTPRYLYCIHHKFGTGLAYAAKVPFLLLLSPERYFLIFGLFPNKNWLKLGLKTHLFASFGRYERKSGILAPAAIIYQFIPIAAYHTSYKCYSFAAVILSARYGQENRFCGSGYRCFALPIAGQLARGSSARHPFCFCQSH